MKRLVALVVIILAAASSVLQAQSPDDQYVHIYTLIQQADALSNAGQTSLALQKYLEAQTNLQRLNKVFPEWNPKVVNFRLAYIEEKIGKQTNSLSLTNVAGATSGVSQPVRSPANETEQKLAELASQVRQLQVDNTILQAKLKEALATQPASIDPRELTKAQERIAELTKENDLFKVAMTNQPSEGETAAGSNTLEETRQALAESRRQLEIQAQRVNALGSENSALQKRVNELAAQASTVSVLDETKQSLASANAKIAEQADAAKSWAAEKEALELRMKALAADVAVADALHAENEVLKKQVAELKASAEAGSSSLQRKQLNDAETRLAVLQSDADILRLEKTALQDRLKEANSARDQSARRAQQLERELDSLQTQFGNARGRGIKPDEARSKDLSDQVETLRSRLAVLEADAVPYNREEMALLKEPKPSLPATNTRKAGAANEPPSGTAAMAAEAQRLFASKQYEKAEETYLEILRRDEKSVYTLANLATIQLEMGHLDEAETRLKQALASSPNDAYSLSILGYLKFRQEKYDEALNALSRAAELDPRNAEIQNYLGVILSQKGLRSAAETAFRKAIQLEPNYGSAHNNLAVFYASQQPPWLGLAWWHYQKALAAGQPHNEELEKMIESKQTNATPVVP